MTSPPVLTPTSWWRTIAAGFTDLAGLVWPVRCAGCGRPDVACCPNCRATLAGPVRHVAVPAWPDGTGVHAAAAYAGVPSRLVVAWKERGRHDLTAQFAAPLARALRESLRFAAEWDDLGPDPPLLVPVPTARANRRRRGADLVVELTRHAVAVDVAGRSGVAPVLRHVRRVRDQAGLDAAERRRNLDGALAVRRAQVTHLRDRDVILVDDVVTTGATLAEAARAVSSAGAQVVGACCLCVTMRRQGVSGQALLV